MSLRLEDEPTPTHAAARRVALVLLGFRNDLARHRVLSHLSERQGVLLPAELSLPCTIFADIDVDTGMRLEAELSRLGAMVRLTADDAAAPPAAQPGAPLDEPPVAEPPERRRFALPSRAVRLAMLGAAAVIYAVFLRPIVAERSALEAALAAPQQPRATRASAAAPAAAPAAAARPASAGQIKSLIAQGDLAAALAAIERSAPSAEVLALKGEVHAKRSDWGAARTAYERAVALGSADPDVYLNLASIYRQQGMQTEAVDMLHRAQDKGANGSDFQAMVQLIVREQDAEAAFGAVTSPHFTLSFDAGEDQAAARLIIAQLEDAYLIVGHKLGHYPSHLTPVVLYAAQDFQAVTHSPGWAGALYDGRIKVPVRGLDGGTPELASTIRHEYAHAVVMSLSGGRCPVWLNEGVAMWAEEERSGDREEWALAAIQLNPNVKLSNLERSFGNMSPAQAVAAYAQSYLAVSHIVARYGELPLHRLLTAFASADSTDAAFRQALDIELTSLEAELRTAQGG